MKRRGFLAALAAAVAAPWAARHVRKVVPVEFPAFSPSASPFKVLPARGMVASDFEGISEYLKKVYPPEDYGRYSTRLNLFDDGTIVGQTFLNERTRVRTYRKRRLRK